MRNIKLILQYDGSSYSGWQVQKKEKSVQEIIESAVHSVTGETLRVTGAARTDAGVHAIAQVAAFKTESSLQPDILLRALNANLPHDIRVRDVSECPLDFHPRYSAKNKTYCYLITYPGDYSVFIKKYSWQIPYKLNCAVMREASRYLIGTHDFSSFRASGCNSKNPVRTINEIVISEYSSIDFMGFKFDVPLIKTSIQANAFLRHMVRNIVGTLAEFGRSKINLPGIKEILESKNRSVSGPTAPGSGLFLEKVEY